ALGADVVNGANPVGVAVVALLPRSRRGVVIERLRDAGDSTVTDTASIKSEVQRAVDGLLPHHTRYVGGHPLAGRERGGPQRARAAMFAGHAWVLTPAPDASPAAVEDARWLVTECGATPVLM